MKVRKNDLHLYDDNTISVLRNDREVFIGTIPQIMKRHSDANWLRIQIDFRGELDEAFGVAANKQGIRPKDYVLRNISSVLDGEISALREQIKRYQSEQTVIRSGSKPSAGELKANEAERRQAKAPYRAFPEDSRRARPTKRKSSDSSDDAEARQGNRRGGVERVKNSKHIMHYKHDQYWPFYHVDQKFGKIILTINTDILFTNVSTSH